MSYLVDALRKAEHERRQTAVPTAVALSGYVGSAREGTRVTTWAIVVLVACNLLLFGYLLWPANSVMPTHATPRIEHDASATEPARAPEQTTTSMSQPTRAPMSTATSAEQAAPRTLTVTTSKLRGTSVANATDTSQTPRVAVTLPQVRVHGHLYSNDPSESFILVGGHIYHEGERLPQGTTVVRIGPEGALLDYRGRRFHVDGPG